MATIYTRATKGSALTWQEGDDNIINLNTDKIESVSEDTSPQLGGDLDVNGNKIVSVDNGNIEILPNGTGKIKLAGLDWPAISAGGTDQYFGSVTALDAERSPNTLTLSNSESLPMSLNGARIRFTGTDVTAAGLLENTDYYINAYFDGVVEIKETEFGSPIDNLNAVSPITDFNYEINVDSSSGVSAGAVLTYNGTNSLEWQQPTGGGGGGGTSSDLNSLSDVFVSAPNNGDLLVYDNTDSTWKNQAAPAAGIATVSADTTPTLGGNLNLNNYSITNNGEMNIAPQSVSNAINLKSNTVYIGNPAATSGIAALAVPGQQTITLISNAQISIGHQTDANVTLSPAGAGRVVIEGNLNVNGQSIVSTSGGNIAITPDGTGQTVVKNLKYNEHIHSLGTTSGTITPNAANGNVQTITLNGNLTFSAFTSPVAGQSITLIVNTNGTGRTLTSTMKWAGGDKTLSTTNTTDIISVFYDGTNYWASLSKDFK